MSLATSALCTVLTAVLSQESVSAKSIAFTSISGAAASQLLQDVQLTEVDGFAELPLDTPTGESQSKSLVSTCTVHIMDWAHTVPLQEWLA